MNLFRIEVFKSYKTRDGKTGKVYPAGVFNGTEEENYYPFLMVLTDNSSRYFVTANGEYKRNEESPKDLVEKCKED